jgi:integrase
MTLAEARMEQARARFEAFTAGPVAAMRREMAQRAARQSLSRAGAISATRSDAFSSILPPIEEEKTHSSWQHTIPHVIPSQSLTRVIGGAGELGVLEERKQSAMSTNSTVLHADEIAQLKLYHDSSLAASTRRAYQSDYDSFVDFLRDRFPRLSIENMQGQCTLEHVLAYLNDLCNGGKKISTINRRLSTIKKHILPTLFNRALVPGSRDEQMMRDVEKIVRGIRRTVGAEQRIRGKRPLLIEDIRKMVDVAAEATDVDGNPMPNKRCRDVALLLFMFHSALRRSEVASLLWSDLTFDKRGVVVVIRKSKTDQESKSQPIAIPRLEHSHCAVAALESWKAKSRGEGDSPVFRWISKKDEVQWRVLIDQRIVALIKEYCEAIGLDPSAFAAHSTRSGYVTSSSDRGVPISQMMLRTRHKAVSSISVYCKSEDLFNNAGDRKL